MRFTDSSSALTALIIYLALGSVEAFWRMPCRSRSGLARIDPLISPGGPSEHAHAIHGSSGTSIPSHAKQSQTISSFNYMLM